MISCRELARRMFPRIFVEAIIFAVLSSAILVAEPALKLLAFYSTNVESDHAKTANNAIAFYRDLAAKNNFAFDVTMDGGKLNDPLAQRLPEDVAAACRVRTLHGTWWRLDRLSRGWIQQRGHALALVRELSRRWGFLQQQLAAASCETDGGRSERPTENLPPSFISPANEWYLWKPSPRLNKQVRCP